MEASEELQCVGRMEITKPGDHVGFICGSLPVPTDADFRPYRSTLLVPPAESVEAPRYQMLPAETDLNTLPLLPNIPDRVIPTASKSGEGCQFDSGVVSHNVSRKCEALAVAGIAEYGDEIDVVAPADILKQIFKIPYSKAQLSIAIHRVGDTLILNAGPDVDEGDKMFRHQGSQTKSSDPSILQNFAMHSVRAEACDCPPSHRSSDPSVFQNFAMHSVRAEACDCPPIHRPSEKQSSPTLLPGFFGSGVDNLVSSSGSSDGVPEFPDQRSDVSPKNSEGNQGKFFWRARQGKQQKKSGAINTTSRVGEKLRCPVQESDKLRRIGNSGFLRVLFWKFHNFRMLLGSDLLLFSNEKYVAVSLHLWDVSRQVTPLTWLEAWLDNIMASVPELAICYHRNGVVQGYELLKTNDIFLLKGLSEDGSPAFHPHVVQQNGLSVLRFLQDNCKQDPGAYWLYKCAGEDAIQLFDLSVLPKGHSTSDHDKASSSLPSLLHRERRESLFSLGTLLCRVAHRLSLSKAPDNKIKCVNFFKKCLDFLNEHDHLVVRAYAHEQFARLILKCYEELELTSDSLLLEYQVTATDMEDETSDFPNVIMLKLVDEGSGSSYSGKKASSRNVKLEAAPCLDRNLLFPPETETRPFAESHDCLVKRENPDVCEISSTTPHIARTVTDPISPKLAAIHHVSQAIKSLISSRQLHNTEDNFVGGGHKFHEKTVNYSLCSCGDINCIEVCDIREWLPKSKIDRQMWKLVLLLGESYLSLGEAYKEDGQLHQTLKVVEFACLLYGSMPQHIDDAWFMSSMTNIPSSKLGRLENVVGDVYSSFFEDGCSSSDFSPIYLFWAKAWMLVGDVYVEYRRNKGNEISTRTDQNILGNEVQMSSDIVREVNRLNKKFGQFQQNCSYCSLINCSCQSDRASSGGSASSSHGDSSRLYSRKPSRKWNMRKAQHSVLAFEDDNFLQHRDGKYMHLKDDYRQTESSITDPVWNEDFREGYFVSNLEKDGSEPCKKGATKSTREDGFEPLKDVSKEERGGIFKFLKGPKILSAENYMLDAIYCYDEARKAMNGLSVGAAEIHSVVRKQGWVCNELGRFRLVRGNLSGAEIAFSDAINAFKEVSDHENVILVNCNLAHGRRALAEELVSRISEMKKETFLQNVYKQTVQKAKLEYTESLRYYRSAKVELDLLSNEVDLMLFNEVCTQLAHTLLRLGMLLAENVHLESSVSGSQIEFEGKKKTEMSASDFIWEALSIYESLGHLRRQEAAFAHFQLACYHRDVCLRYVTLYERQLQLLKSGSTLKQKAKWYASLAEKNWQKSRDFYSPKTHPAMNIKILLEQASLSVNISAVSRSNTMSETALIHLLEARRFKEPDEEHLDKQDPNIRKKFWNHLQSLLKNMLTVSLPSRITSRPGTAERPAAAPPVNRDVDSQKLHEMYRMSLKSQSLRQLNQMYELWIS